MSEKKAAARAERAKSGHDGNVVGGPRLPHQSIPLTTRFSVTSADAANVTSSARNTGTHPNFIIRLARPLETN